MNSNVDSEVKDINGWPLQSSDKRRDEINVSPMTRQRKYNDSYLSKNRKSIGETVEREQSQNRRQETAPDDVKIFDDNNASNTPKSGLRLDGQALDTKGVHRV